MATWALLRLCEYHEVDPDHPGATYRPPTNWKPRVVLAAIIVFLVGMFLLGALTRP